MLLKPVAITKDNIKVVFDDGFLKREDVCTGKFERCARRRDLDKDGTGAPPRAAPPITRPGGGARA